MTCEDRRLSLREVGFLLGVVDVTTSHRAFTRRTESTPGEYRRAATGDRQRR